MTRFILYLFDFFSERKAMLFVAVTSILFIAGFFASRLQLEEDISKMLPADERIEKMNFIFKNSKFLEKLVVNIYSDEVNPELLAVAADSLASIIGKTDVDSTIQTIDHKVNDDQILKLYDFFYENLPLYLDKEDYKKIENKLSQNAVKEMLKESYQSLTSPAAFVLKKSIRRDPLGITNLALNKLQEIQFDENLILKDGYIYSKDLKNLLLFITPANASSETAKNKQMLQVLDSAISKTQSATKVKIEYFGQAAVASGNAERIKSDVILTVSIAMAVLLIFIAIFFRRLWAFFAIFFPALFGATVALATIYWVKGNVSAVSLGIGSVLLGITVDYALHLFTHNRTIGDARRSVMDIAGAVLISSLTTGFAFLCLLFVRSEALNSMGLFAAVSCFSAALFSLIALPHFLPKSNHTGKPSLGIVDRLTGYNYHNNKFLVLIILCLSVVFYFTSLHVGFESDMEKMNYVQPHLKQAEKNLDELYNYKLKSVYLISSGKNIDQALISNASAQKTVKNLVESGAVQKFTSVGNLILSQAQQKEKIDQWNHFWTLNKKENLQQNINENVANFKLKPQLFNPFWEMVNKEFKPLALAAFEPIKNTVLSDYISSNDQLTTVVTLLKTTEQNKEYIYAAFENAKNTIVVDKKYMMSSFINILRQDFRFLVQISLFVVLCILLVAFNSLEIALVTFIPMLLSWLWTLGIMGAVGLQFNIFNIIVSTFIFGLGIDYGIFVTRGLLQEYAYGRKNLSSYKSSIFLSALTTMAGIGVLVFAHHPALKSIALVSIIGILSSVLMSYTIQPILFKALTKWKGEYREYPLIFWNMIRTISVYSFVLTGTLFILCLSLLIYPLVFVPMKKRKLFIHYGYMWWARVYLAFVFPGKQMKFFNPNGEDFVKPALIISNHRSLIDTPMLLRWSPKIIMLTKPYVWNSPMFGPAVRMGDFYPFDTAVEHVSQRLKHKVEEGYSVQLFPEGTRSLTNELGRFHKGAFYLAQALNLDILPLYFHGAGDFLPKGNFFGRETWASIKIGERIKLNDKQWGEGYSKRGKAISKFYKQEYSAFVNERTNPSYLKRQLRENYYFKGVYWYLRYKMKVRKNYQNHDHFLPEKGLIYDLGSGYGFLALLLNRVENERHFIGIDQNTDKVLMAQHCRWTNKYTEFICADVLNCEFEPSNAFVVNGILQMLNHEDQVRIIKKAFKSLLPGGIIVIDTSEPSGLIHNLVKAVLSDLPKKHYPLIEPENLGFEQNEIEKTGDFIIIRKGKKDV